MNKPLYNYKWNLKTDYPEIKNGLKVYSTFACGGGSTMGYKLAGYDVIGANDIDKQMAKIYQKNHSPKFYDLCPINELLSKELPIEYYNLDILDGSPPCSTFSLAGSREKAWKKDKVFREGQAKQVLSDLFFDWIALVDKLKPKIAIAENVKGMLIGNAKAYTKKILEEIDKIGYDCQLFCLNGATMGLPQARERVFFICKRKDLKMPKLVLEFNKKPIFYKEIEESKGKELTEGTLYRTRWEKRKKRDLDYAHICEREENKRTNFSIKLITKDKVCPTIVSGSDFIKFDKPEHLSNYELQQIGSYPLDYDFMDVQPKYLIGMSVPPVMTAQIANQIAIQLFNLYL
jgi:DNA (cytosine-5)-methyltransferase 1